MAKWSKYTYEAIAYEIAAVRLNCRAPPAIEARTADAIARRLARRFAADNPRFDCDRFLRACGVLEEVRAE